MSDNIEKTAFTSINYSVVQDQNGCLIMDKSNNFLIANKVTGEVMYIPLNQENKYSFNLELEEEIIDETQELSPPLSPSLLSPNKNKAQWCRNSTLQLISLMKDSQNSFKSTSIRNDTIYANIAKRLKELGYNFTSSQVKDKCKYLKLRYTKKKDNMKNTGEDTIHCEYFEELNEIFGRKPNIEPISIASSSKGFTANSKEVKNILENTEKNEPPMKKLKKEDDVERRHKEKLEVQRNAIHSFEKIMEKLIEKL